MAVRRPPDRKQRIAAAAADLFRERGFRNVSVADVAEAVGITAPALYRHFKNKQALLGYVVSDGLEVMDRIGREAESLDELLRAAIALVADQRGLATLWRREARHLPEAEREELRHHLSGIAGRYAALIRAERPDLPEADSTLLAWSLLGVLASLAGHRYSLPRRRLEALLTRLTSTVVRCELGTAAPSEPTEAVPDPAQLAQPFALSRREQMLTEAIRLFDERGFQSVSTDDIGEAVGTSGPNVYKHFPSKTDLLVAGVVRGGERRAAGTAQALARGGDPRQTLDLLLHAHIDFALENGHLLGLLLSELDQLPEEQRKRSLQVQREYVELWVKVLDQAAPGLDATEAKIVVLAVLSVVDSAARTGRLRSRPDLDDRLFEIGTALLLAR
ncbi:TetR/AcrR family transcriptional regulator [Streptacidiphilus jiangxiensis]|uniref:DNA-binding transcriptional regulator, AcrR family n=1 Tax=Streptacidiphilus jiangxiensis TaxID=235985 RepID=A0A1H7T5Q5_STRJI|nr:TetR/AcrR family transcriptional regulator [Streptacidiphilus jiangxiensis]SEL79829.1 DNA-binding transcriptional regulator, AcrR family [Streptacidiphilus jiangxiensis]